MAVLIFAQLTKVDVAKREVWGRATQEVLDKAAEIFDYETSVPFFKAWSEGFAKDTDGKSLGNVRSMHSKVAAGKVISIVFNDAEKAIDIGVKVVDDNEWEKVTEGVHTGFSIGGAYVKKWADPEIKGATRFTADPAEISLVDSPCVPTAKFFDVVKADGVVEQVAFKDAPVPFHKAALTMGELRKGLGTVADLAYTLQGLGWMATRTTYEAEQEGDGSPIPERLRGIVAQLAALLQDMTIEETAELLTYIPVPPAATEVQVLEMAAGLGLELAKGGAKFSASTKKDLSEKHQVACDHMENLNKALATLATCWTGPDKEASDQGEMEKLQAEQAEALQKADEAVQKVAILEADLSKATETIADLTAQVALLEDMPEPVKGVLKALISKSEDVTLNSLEAAKAQDAEELAKVEAMPDGPAKALAQIKHIHRTGGR